MLEGCQIVNLNLSRNPRWVEILFYDPMLKVYSLLFLLSLIWRLKKISLQKWPQENGTQGIFRHNITCLFKVMLLSRVFNDVNQSDGLMKDHPTLKTKNKLSESFYYELLCKFHYIGEKTCHQYQCTISLHCDRKDPTTNSTQKSNNVALSKEVNTNFCWT